MSSNPSYLIETNPRRNSMRLTFAGYLDHATLDRFEQEMAVAFARMPARNGRRGDCLFLADLRESGVQSRDISERLQAIIAHYGPLIRRIAMLLSGSALEMMQAKRVAGQDGKAFFVSEDDASAWLFDDRTGVAAPM